MTPQEIKKCEVCGSYLNPLLNPFSSKETFEDCIVCKDAFAFLGKAKAEGEKS